MGAVQWTCIPPPPGVNPEVLLRWLPGCDRFFKYNYLDSGDITRSKEPVNRQISERDLHSNGTLFYSLSSDEFRRFPRKLRLKNMCTSVVISMHIVFLCHRMLRYFVSTIYAFRLYLLVIRYAMHVKGVILKNPTNFLCSISNGSCDYRGSWTCSILLLVVLFITILVYYYYCYWKSWTFWGWNLKIKIPYVPNGQTWKPGKKKKKSWP